MFTSGSLSAFLPPFAARYIHLGNSASRNCGGRRQPAPMNSHFEPPLPACGMSANTFAVCISIDTKMMLSNPPLCRGRHLIRHGCAVPPSPEKGRLWGPPVWRCATVFAENMVPCPSQTAPLKYRLSDISYPRQAGKLPQGEGSEVTTGGICARLGRGGFMDQVCIRQPESISLAIWKVDFRNSSG